MMAADQALRHPRLAQTILLLLAFSVAFMQPAMRFLGMFVVPTDLLFVACLAAALPFLLRGARRLRWSSGVGVVLLYFGALSASVPGSEELHRSTAKLAAQVYVLAIPLLVYVLIDTLAVLRRVILWWLAGTAVVAVVGVLSLVVFLLDRQHPLLDITRFHFGTLPEGDYPRLRLTFLNANMLCNYLTVSLVLTLAALRERWLKPLHAGLLVVAVALCALFTISPGLGGVLLAGAFWAWLALRDDRPRLAGMILAAGAAAALLFVAVLAVTPVIHPTAPFVIRLPFDVTLAPSGRLMTWMDAAATFWSNPIFGKGIGTDAVWVLYRNPGGYLGTLTDAHNSYLSIAAQTGLVGLAGLVAVIAWAWRRSRPFRFNRDGGNSIRLACGFAFLNALAYQGIGGSFEDARHIWFLFGLLLAASRIEAASHPVAGQRRSSETALSGGAKEGRNSPW